MFEPTLTKVVNRASPVLDTYKDIVVSSNFIGAFNGVFEIGYYEDKENRSTLFNCLMHLAKTGHPFCIKDGPTFIKKTNAIKKFDKVLLKDGQLHVRYPKGVLQFPIKSMSETQYNFITDASTDRLSCDDMMDIWKDMESFYTGEEETATSIKAGAYLIPSGKIFIVTDRKITALLNVDGPSTERGLHIPAEFFNLKVKPQEFVLGPHTKVKIADDNAELIFTNQGYNHRLDKLLEYRKRMIAVDYEDDNTIFCSVTPQIDNSFIKLAKLAKNENISIKITDGEMRVDEKNWQQTIATVPYEGFTGSYKASSHALMCWLTCKHQVSLWSLDGRLIMVGMTDNCTELYSALKSTGDTEIESYKLDMDDVQEGSKLA